MIRTLATIGFLCGAMSAFAEEAPNRELKVGDKVPAFKLTDANGKQVSLDDLLKRERYVALVFYRSADW